MSSHKILDLILNIVPKSHWNDLSNILARFSRKTIGSPIHFSCGQFRLQEYNYSDISPELRKCILDFSIPLDTPHREQELEYDRQYWERESTFLIFDKNGEIAGCVQFVPRIGELKMPVEYGQIRDKNSNIIPEGGLIKQGKYAEVYHCRKAQHISKRDSVTIIGMLFKATWAKIIQTKTDYSLISFDPDNVVLKNMYLKKLGFEATGSVVDFGDGKNWDIIDNNWHNFEKNFAQMGKSQFTMMTWFRKNLVIKNWGMDTSTLPIALAPAANITVKKHVEIAVSHFMPDQAPMLAGELIEVQARIKDPTQPAPSGQTVPWKPIIHNPLPEMKKDVTFVEWQGPGDYALAA